MLTRKTLNSKIGDFLAHLPAYGFLPEKAILFGSYAKGNVHEQSDIDLAVWAKGFTGNPLVDTPLITHLLHIYHPIEIHAFPSGPTLDDFSFIQEIESTNQKIEF